MITVPMFGLFMILVSTAPAHPIMGDIDASMPPLSFDMSTVATVQEIDNTTDMEPKLNSSKSSVEETNGKMALTPAISIEENAANPSTASLDILMDVTTTTSSLSITQKDKSNSIPVVAKMAELVEVATTSSFVMDNNIQTTEPATNAATTTTVITHVASTSAASSAEIPTVAEHSTTSAIANEIVQDKTMAAPVTEFDFSNIFGSMTQVPGAPAINDIFGGNNLPSDDAIPSKVNENSIAPLPPHDEVDNVLTLPSNEDTTRIASSTDSKADNDKKEVVPLASKTEPEPEKKPEDDGKNVSNSISASFVVLLSVAVFYVIV